MAEDNKIVAGVLLVGGLAGLGYWYMKSKKEEELKPPPPLPPPPPPGEEGIYIQWVGLIRPTYLYAKVLPGNTIEYKVTFVNYYFSSKSPAFRLAVRKGSGDWGHGVWVYPPSPIPTQGVGTVSITNKVGTDWKQGEEIDTDIDMMLDGDTTKGLYRSDDVFTVGSPEIDGVLILSTMITDPSSGMFRKGDIIKESITVQNNFELPKTAVFALSTRRQGHPWTKGPNYSVSIPPYSIVGVELACRPDDHDWKPGHVVDTRVKMTLDGKDYDNLALLIGHIVVASSLEAVKVQLASIWDYTVGCGLLPVYGVPGVWVLRQGVWLYYDYTSNIDDVGFIKTGETVELWVNIDCTLSYKSMSVSLSAGVNTIMWVAAND